MKRIDWDIDWELVLIIVGMLIVGVCVFGLIFSIDGDKKAADSFVGKNIVFDGDTLTVMDYSLMKSSYSLSNGLSIDQEFLQSLDTLTCK